MVMTNNKDADIKLGKKEYMANKSFNLRKSHNHDNIKKDNFNKSFNSFQTIKKDSQNKNYENIDQNENVAEFRKKIVEKTKFNNKKLSKDEIEKIFREIDDKMNGKPDLYQ